MKHSPNEKTKSLDLNAYTEDWTAGVCHAGKMSISFGTQLGLPSKRSFLTAGLRERTIFFSEWPSAFVHR
jgi:hypothetical protein